ncbi:dihydroorotate dehydrogenase electron transfer subunit [Bacillus marinisedimentorum]|uniref:dihydroorotate dehydrogenase electron transfer subunit n=1 Tax=Bacillus marinisedimentorum TaxID=1821260 RepID=UPI0007DFC3D7|nr:dihydroorotate dehydrogenase electron transfer subunit [Bacillus marinisedimentorum]
MKRTERMKVVSQKLIAEDIYELVLTGTLVEEMGEPGQFVHIKVSDGNDPLLRRPISICDIDHEAQTFTVVYRKEGRGTAVLSEKKQGAEVDVLGPLGNGFPAAATDGGQTALLVGGGIGVPPLYYLSKKLKKLGVKVIHVLGFKTEGAVFYEKEFNALGMTHITTEDGSFGTKGFVTDVIEKENLLFDTMYACGPTAMLKAVSSGKSDSSVFISLEERMGCGIGACFACVCHTADDPDGFSYKKVCSDGPVFRAGEVVLP